MHLPLPPFRRVLEQVCGVPIVVPILIEVGLAVFRPARRCSGATSAAIGATSAPSTRAA